ncbi:transcriptional regulator [Cupriavidus sp. TMH.W2]|uniref:transcriptional regulator n=1 Tax=Cupriavidus sp. TMH.W2 TaxID=3434465 RepID=UPI003D77FB11
MTARTRTPVAQRGPQQQFLHEAMTELQLGRVAFAERFGMTKRALDNWLMPSGSTGYRDMPQLAWRYVGEVLAWHRQGVPVHTPPAR